MRPDRLSVARPRGGIPRLVRQHAVVDLTSPGTAAVRARLRFAGLGLPPLAVAPDVEISELRLDGVRVEPVCDPTGVLRLPSAGVGTRLDVLTRAPLRADGHGVVGRGDAVFTHFQPHGMRRLLPSDERPGLPASFSWTLVLPTGWTAYGPSRSRSVNRDGASRWRFTSPHPMPFSSTGFAAGRWRTRSSIVRSIDGRELRISANATPGAADAPSLDAIVSLAGDAVRWLERWLGAPLPVEVWDQVFVDRHPTGALETAGCPSFDAALLTAADPQRLRTLVVHELVHAWFGTLATPRGWEELWMAEGPAGYLAERCLAELDAGGAWAQFDLGPRIACAAVATTPFAHPVRPDAIDGDPADQFDELSYTGAALLLERWENEWGHGVLHRVLGDAAAGGARAIDLDDWMRLAGSSLDEASLERMRRQLTGPWAAELARAPAGIAERASLALADAWLDVVDGTGLVMDATAATIAAIGDGRIPDAAVPPVVALAERQLGGASAPAEFGALRVALRSALAVRANGGRAHGCLHAWIDLAGRDEEDELTRVVAEKPRPCCTAALDARTAGWRHPPQLSAMWDALAVARPPTGTVLEAAAVQRELDAAAAELFAERYLGAVSGFAAHPRRLEASFLVRALYPWCADPARLATNAQAAAADPSADGAILAWVSDTARRCVAARGGTVVA